MPLTCPCKRTSYLHHHYASEWLRPLLAIWAPELALLAWCGLISVQLQCLWTLEKPFEKRPSSVIEMTGTGERLSRPLWDSWFKGGSDGNGVLAKAEALATARNAEKG
eukprot:2330375-Rhodomonas_salina.2